MEKYRLPAELIYPILGHCFSDGYVRHEERRRDTLALRLACRTFDTIVRPLAFGLFPRDRAIARELLELDRVGRLNRAWLTRLLVEKLQAYRRKGRRRNRGDVILEMLSCTQEILRKEEFCGEESKGVADEELCEAFACLMRHDKIILALIQPLSVSGAVDGVVKSMWQANQESFESAEEDDDDEDEEIEDGGELSERPIYGESRHAYALEVMVYRNEELVVKRLLDAGYPIENTRARLKPLLQIPASKGHVSMLDTLLRHGIDVDLFDTEDPSAMVTPLHLATRYGHSAAASLLLDKEAFAARGDEPGGSALHCAADYGQDVVAEKTFQQAVRKRLKLVNAKDYLSRRPLSYAAEHGHLTTVRFLLDHGARVNTYPCPLSDAAMNGHLSIVDLLLQRGCAVDGTGGQTPLAYAAERGHLAVMKLQLESGADVNASAFGSAALSLAAQNGQVDAVKLLLEHGAVASHDSFESPLYLALREGHARVAELLLESDIDLEAPLKGDRAPLLMKPNDRRARLEICELAIAKGANRHLKGHQGKSILWDAGVQEDEPLLRRLLEHGVNPNQRDEGGQTALFQAVTCKNELALRVLLEYGARKDRVDCMGQTPRLIAERKGYHKIVKLLDDHKS